MTLRAVVVMDYQNVHLTGAGLFHPSDQRHLHLVHPLHYANQLITTRNRNQRAGHAHAVLTKVLVHRGLPSGTHEPIAYRRNLAQKAEWEKDPRVTVVHRPLKYTYKRTADGKKATDGTGQYLIEGKPQEKGVDVLCALALVREAREQDIDLVVLCSQDTDLEPAPEEAARLGSAKVETASWFDNRQHRQSREIRNSGGARLWNTRLGLSQFDACVDLTDYT
jgi:hypothetical protein